MDCPPERNCTFQRGGRQWSFDCSTWEIEPLGSSLGSVFPFFSLKSSQWSCSQNPGQMPGPWSFVTALTCTLYRLEIQYCNCLLFGWQEFFSKVVSMTAELIAKWQGVGFAHGELQQLEKVQPPQKPVVWTQSRFITNSSSEIAQKLRLVSKRLCMETTGSPLFFSTSGFVRFPGFF